MTNETNAFAIGLAPATQRPIAKKRGGWPPGVKRNEIAAYHASKAAKEASDTKNPPDTHLERPQSDTPAGVQAAPVPAKIESNLPAGNGALPPSGGDNLPKPVATRLRHQLRPLSEYPADMMTSDKLHIPRNQWPDGRALQWGLLSVWNQPFLGAQTTDQQTGWEPVHPDDFHGKFAHKVPADWGDRPIVVDGLILMARPMQWQLHAQARDKREAQQVINIRVRQLHKGELEGISLDVQHKHLDQTNFVRAQIDQVGTSGDGPKSID